MKRSYLTIILAAAVFTSALTACSNPQPAETIAETTAQTTTAAETSNESTVTTTVSETTSVTVESTSQSSADDYRKDSIFGSLDDINYVCLLQSVCETETDACKVIVDNGSDNPYDVIYDYGSDYQAYVDACDWDLVFDSEYYKSTFPMLAVQYHDDDALLLKHFQTVGIHEGRQGSGEFNVQAYAFNCSDEIYKAFSRNWAAYYFYYLMNYETEKNINTVTANNGKPVYQQMTCVYTALQKKEFESVNKYRSEVDVSEVSINSELCAFANYRAYLNSHDGFNAHDWAKENDPVIYEYLSLMGSTNGIFGENTVTQRSNSGIQDYALQYYNSPSHYELMTSSNYNYVGCSNFYWYESKSIGSQFDVYSLDLHTII